jgi:hypothetical protein
MSKSKASIILDMPKNRHKHFWNQVIRDAEIKLSNARRKAVGLEESLKVFRRNAAEGVPIPGEVSAARIKRESLLESVPAINSNSVTQIEEFPATQS